MEKMIREIISEIDSFKKITFSDAVKIRLDKNLRLYLSDLQNSYNTLSSNIKKKSLIREISKSERK